MSTSSYLYTIQKFLTEHNFRVEREKTIPGIVPKIDVYAFHEGRSLGKLFPYEDHFFIYDTKTNLTKKQIDARHNEARTYVNSLFKKPKWIRYKVPNIVTVIIAHNEFDEETIAYAATPITRTAWDGGERDSVYLIDVKNKLLHCQGMQETTGKGMSGGLTVNIPITFKTINPDNRAYSVVANIAQKLFDTK